MQPQVREARVRLPTDVVPARAPSAGSGLAELWSHRSLVWAFVLNDLRERYLGSSIGFFWTVVTPLLELITYTFVFHVLLAVKFHPAGGWTHYALFLFCGMVTWFAMSDGLTRATDAVTGHGNLVRKIHFPAMVLPAHVIASAVLNQSIRLGVLALAALVLGQGLSWHFLLVPFVVLIQASFTMGLGMVLSTVNVYFRDTIHWVNASLLLWMFVTPVFYPAAVYPKKFILLLNLNPLAHIVGVYQELILNHRMPHPHSVLVAVAAGVFMLIIGYSVFRQHEGKFSDLV